VVLEVTAPRIPCATLAARMGDPQFVKKYRRAERPGLYCRVIREGNLQTGNEVRLALVQVNPFWLSSCSVIITRLTRMKRPFAVSSALQSPSVPEMMSKPTCKRYWLKDNFWIS
jgi:MOSC domain-containing protein YiiM